MNRAKWSRIACYYLIALAGSALTRFYWHTGDPALTLRSAGSLYWHLLGGAGPALGAACVVLVFGYRQNLRLGGSNLPLALAMIATPALVMGALGISNGFGIEPHLFGVHLGIWIALYGVLEELGWRGYLQSEFRDLSALRRYVVVGLFWYVWHFSWVEGHPLPSEIVSLGFIVLASIGIGFVADRTGSVLAAAAFHTIGDVMGLIADFRVIMPDAHLRLAVVGACVAIWIVIMRVWRRRDLAAAAK